MKRYNNPYILWKVLLLDGKYVLEEYVEKPVREGNMAIAASTQHELTYMLWSREQKKTHWDTYAEDFEYWKAREGQVVDLNKTFQRLDWDKAEEFCLAECTTAKEAVEWFKRTLANE